MMNFVMDDRFECFIEEFGKPDYSVPAEKETIDQYYHILPERLLAYWSAFGFCRFNNGMFWIVNPNNFEAIKNDWLPNEIENKHELHVIARNAFGDLYVWSKTHGFIYRIEPVDGTIFQKEGDAERLSQGKETESIQGFFAVRDKYIEDREDVDTEASIFDYAIEHYGPLAEDEMFTFEPAPFLGGEQSCQNVRKVNLFIQLDILSNLASKEVLDINGLTQRAFS